MDGIGGKRGWAWIFILVGTFILQSQSSADLTLLFWQEGLLTFVFGFSGFFLIPSTPAEAKFLTEEEKA
jgi:hypothetical protein